MSEITAKDISMLCDTAAKAQDRVIQLEDFTRTSLDALTAVHEANERREITLPTEVAALVWEALLLAHNGNIAAMKVAEVK